MKASPSRAGESRRFRGGRFRERRALTCGCYLLVILFTLLGYGISFYRLQFFSSQQQSIESLTSLALLMNYHDNNNHTTTNTISSSSVWFSSPALTNDDEEEDDQILSVEDEVNSLLSSPPPQGQEREEQLQENEELYNNENSDLDNATEFSSFNSSQQQQQQQASPSPWQFHRSSWRPRPESDFTIPFPVFVASLPKSGTTSINSFFLCGGVRSAHHFCPGQYRLGPLIQRNIQNGVPPFEGCEHGFKEDTWGPYKAFSDVGYVLPTGACYYPSISSLDDLYQAYPEMTIVLGTRNSTKWYESMKGWGKGSLVKRWAKYCSFMPASDDYQEYIDFYEWHNQHIRNFVIRHPSITYIEFAIDSPTAGMELEQATNISASCWGHSKPVDTRVIKLRRQRRKGNRSRKRQQRQVQE